MRWAEVNETKRREIKRKEIGEKGEGYRRAIVCCRTEREAVSQGVGKATGSLHLREFQNEMEKTQNTDRGVSEVQSLRSSELGFGLSNAREPLFSL